MQITLNNAPIFVGTGGKEFDRSLPTVLFLHGSGMDHRSWVLQTRWFAFNGFSVLAPDFPGHSLSAGEPLQSVEASADFLVDLLEELGCEAVHVVGHSQGFLAGLQLAANHPERVLSLVGIGTAAAIPVNPALIKTAEQSAFAAAEMMLNWGFGQKMHRGLSPTPGIQPIAQGRQIMGHNPLAEDLKACAAYQGGADALTKLTMPTAFILAGQDKMTPLKAGLAVAKQLKSELTVLPDFGHMLPVEAPAQVLQALKSFIKPAV